MIQFALLTLFAVIFKLLATQYYTIFAAVTAAVLFFSGISCRSNSVKRSMLFC